MAIFNEMDADGGGSLDKEEIRNLAKSLGNTLSGARLYKAWRSFMCHERVQDLVASVLLVTVISGLNFGAMLS